MITIEGTITPSVVLDRGERITVERTTFVDALLRRGFVKIIAEDEPDQRESHDLATFGGEVVRTVHTEPPVAPLRRASKAQWREYLDALGVPWHEDMTRAVLIGLADDEAARRG